MTKYNKILSLVSAILDKHIIPILIVFSILGTLAVFIHIIKFEKKLVELMAVENSENLANTLEEFRNLYTSEVVIPAKAAGIEITHDYKGKPNAIPLPATLSMLIGNKASKHLNGGETRLFSPYPFPWRKDTGGIRDEFGEEAWKALKENPDKPFYRIEEQNGKKVMRYAVADVMRPKCVNCHNTHPDTPKNNWQTGDLRGVLEIIKPLNGTVVLSRANIKETLVLLFSLIISGLTIFYFVVKSLRKREYEAKKAEEKATRLNLQMQEYADKLELARMDAVDNQKAAEKANRAKSEFLANMSHELRTPMNGIIGMCEMLVDSNLNEDQRENATILHSSSESLLSILNDVLDISKIEAGELKLENVAFDLEVSVQQIIQLFQPLANDAGLSLNIDHDKNIPPIIVGDLGRVQQILRNLIGNALKFTEKGSITVTTKTITKSDQAFLYLAVKDTGIGIPKDKLEEIFEKFTQADSSITRKFGGTGLGLAITQKLVYLMGGEIGVESLEKRGSTFWFTMPLVIAKDGEKPVNLGNKIIDSSKTSVSRDINILSVDDYPTNQFFVKKLLKKLGFNNVSFAENGKMALEMIENGDYDVILMDCQMPELDGYQATQILRKTEEKTGKHLPVIALTANAMIGDKEKCLQAGMDDYLSKPIRPEKLLNLLNQYTNINVKASNHKGTPPPTNEETAVVDLAHLANFTDGDPDEEKELFDLFFEQADISIGELEQACAENNSSEWKKTAHRIKGSSANLGANILATICKKAEMEFEASKSDKEAMLAEIKEKLNDVRKFLK